MPVLTISARAMVKRKPLVPDWIRTAEVVSKVLLLARDKDIKDPGIVSQIRAG